MSAAPSRIGRYDIERELGRGGMGVVYLARDTTLDRRVAIKVLPDELACDPERLHRFQREARMLASLQHANVAGVHGLEEQDAHYLIMEYVEGETLDALLRGGPLDVQRAIDVARQIALAIEAAHARNVIHRDLKPANVRVTPAGVVKVLDFGLAKAVTPERQATADDATQVTGPTLHGQVLGTPGYMSPEQACGGDVDRRTDVWAFGCVLYECLTGRRAFAATSPSAAAAEVLTADPDWSRLPTSTPSPVQELLLRCLEKDPRRRLADMREARERLERAWGEQPTIWTSAGARSGPPNNLPAQVSSFVGRHRELGDLAERIAEARLVTLAGAGGCGKTRLALELAAQLARRPDFPLGVWYVELAPMGDAALVIQAVAAALGLKDKAGEDLRDTLVERLRHQAALLILDNCEHVLDTCAELAHALLSACPDLRIVATSREALGIAGEAIFRVPSLSCPGPAPDLAALMASEAAQLFVERARAANDTFTLGEADAAPLAEICRRLDGIPLAIELAAARTRALGIDQIARRLDASFRLLTGGSKAALPRHQTLRATFDWSYGLLETAEQTALRRLSVFTGGWTLDAAEHVCANDDVDAADVLDLLSALVDKSIVMYEERAHGGGRYRLLETMRQYAGEELSASGETERLRDRHARYFVEYAEAAEPGLIGPDQATWYARLEADRDNLLGAMQWCASAPGGLRDGLRIAGAMWQFWATHGHISLGRAIMGEVLGRPDPEPGRERAKALSAAGILAKEQADYDEARRLHEEALAIRLKIDDRKGKAGSLNNLALIARARGDLAEARRLQSESLAIYREIGDRWGEAVMLGNLGDLALAQGDLPAAGELLEESLRKRRELNDTQGQVHALCNLAVASIRRGNLDSASRQLAECLRLSRTIGDKSNGPYALEAAGQLAAARGDGARAIVLLRAAERMRETIGSPLPPAERAQLGAMVSQLCESLGPEACAEASDRGRALVFEAAADIALEAQ